MIGTKSVFYLYYYERDNMFTDEDGNIIYDLFTLITPQDLFLFRYDHSHYIFPMVGRNDINCEILLIEDAVRNALYSVDIGDDYERIERFERAKYGCFI